MPNTFFQQDEWQTLAGHIYFLTKGITGVIESFLPYDSLSHFNPLSTIFSWVNYLFYKTNFTPYALQSIILQILNTGLLYYLVFSWLKNRNIAIISSLIFATNSVASQAVTWVAATNGYGVPMLLILLSVIFFHKFLRQGKDQNFFLILSLIMLFISFLFHENGIFLLLFYPLIFFLFAKKRRKKLYNFFFSCLIITIVIFIIIRIPFLFGFESPIPVATEISHPSVAVYPYRLISLGMKSFAAIFFPDTTIIQISEKVVRLAYPQFVDSDNIPNAYIVQSIVFDLVSYSLTVIVVCIAIFCMRFIRDKKIHRAILWSFIFIPFSVFPYAFVLGKAGFASIFEPRFLYIPSVGASVLLASIVYGLIVLSKKSKIKTTLLLLFLGFYILFHIFQTRTKIDELQKMGNLIKIFLSTIHSSYPHLPQNVVFFTQSDTAYYGMPANEKTLPVEVGFGKMLMIWYQADEKFSRCLYENNFLIYLLEQGYRQCEGRGFGYFRDYNKLKISIEENKIPLKNVISFSWNGNTKTFKNISNEIMIKLQKDEK